MDFSCPKDVPKHSAPGASSIAQIHQCVLSVVLVSRIFHKVEYNG